MSTIDAVKILRARFVGKSRKRALAVVIEHVNADVAQIIYDLRAAAGLTQEQLAEVIGTTQSSISRLEDADYSGHSLSMLVRIAFALGHKVEVVVAREENQT